MNNSSLFIAGIGNSDSGHWQRIWFEQAKNGIWVEHADWDQPHQIDWLSDLQTVLASTAGPKILIAHSLGCLLVTEWAQKFHDSSVIGALLVCPPDVFGKNFPAQAQGFSSITTDLPFPSVVIFSRDDPYSTPDFSTLFAQNIGAKTYDVGYKGHVNSQSELGAWAEGWQLVERFFENS